jgi:hypothetical protein
LDYKKNIMSTDMEKGKGNKRAVWSYPIYGFELKWVSQCVNMNAIILQQKKAAENTKQEEERRKKPKPEEQEDMP